MNTHLKQLWAAMKLPEKLQKKLYFFCRGLDIRVTEHMRGDMLLYSCKSCVMPDHKSHRLIGQLFFAPVYKKASGRRNFRGEGVLIGGQGREHCRIPDLQDSFFGAFAVNTDGFFLQVDMLGL